MLAKLVKFVVCLIFLRGAYSECLQSCVSDMQCKGFTNVSQTFYCWKNCCSTANTVIGDNLFTQDCIGGIELWTNQDANQFPWLGYMLIQDGERCVYCMAVLISPEWVTSDNSCYTPLASSVQNTPNEVYFFYDDPFRRQVYSAIDSRTGGDGLPLLTGYIKIGYIGLGTPIPITPMPVNCDTTLSPSSATVFFWDKPAGGPTGTRTFTSKTVALYSNSFCSAAIATAPDWQDMPNDYICVSGTADNGYFYTEVTRLFQGAPIMIQDSSGAWLYLGSGMNVRKPQFSYGNGTLFVRAAEAMTGSPNLQTLFGATCA